MPAYSELLHDASHAIAQVQKALNSRLVACLLCYLWPDIDSSLKGAFDNLKNAFVLQFLQLLKPMSDGRFYRAILSADKIVQFYRHN